MPKLDALSFLSPSFATFSLKKTKDLLAQFGSAKELENVAPHAQGVPEFS